LAASCETAVSIVTTLVPTSVAACRAATVARCSAARVVVRLRPDDDDGRDRHRGDDESERDEVRSQRPPSRPRRGQIEVAVDSGTHGTAAVVAGGGGSRS
jgi:hypothetical protein